MKIDSRYFTFAWSKGYKMLRIGRLYFDVMPCPLALAIYRGRVFLNIQIGRFFISWRTRTLKGA